MITRDRLVQTFLELVKIDSPSGKEEKMARDVSRRLANLGAKVKRDKVEHLFLDFVSLIGYAVTNQLINTIHD